MYDELIQQARELCDAAKAAKERGSIVDSAALSWEITQNSVPQLCDALEAAEKDAAAKYLEIVRLTARAEKAEAENRWIPVSEKLPEQDGSYLVIDESENMFNSTFDGSCGDNGEFGEWSAIYDQHTLGYLDSEWNSYSGITHWRPLPEPPKGE